MTFTGTKTEIQQFLYKLDKDTKYDLKIDKHRNKRSLGANNYTWHLINEIANALRLSKEEIYFQMLKAYGQRDYISMLSNVNASDYFKYYEIESKTDKYTWYRIFKGSSKYDTKEMSILLNGVVSECKEMGIPTKEEWELKRMVEYWERENF